MPRFLTLSDVAEQLQLSAAATYALVRSGELAAIQIGGRGQWRVEESKFEEFIQARYAATEQLLAASKPAPAPDVGSSSRPRS
ncbi:helix-turn-helix domain-containing protein [Paenarthrobacter sp. PH39-S1]|uniref:helix-turn-helix domain-containing protein n=1 Tax=Paenarthrobacter sp. PH39-S1 TaxID=3046204 RepID=UPI0024B88464|nr:helix-turn-helix domain-containing protein [Paenarthrobacter sp. PH39-S1]MDJ0356442.1 helix-turn-helix domain-containing protein [Paenarthrobacter sp. PH39-S1]